MAYTTTGVDFDGTNDYMLRGADLTGSADSKIYSGAGWYKRNATGVAGFMYRNTGNKTRIDVNAGDRLVITARASSGGDILLIRSSAHADTNWHHFMFSVDLVDTGKRHLYLDNVDELDVVTYTDATIDFTRADHAIGALTSGGSKFNGCLADLWIEQGVFIDLSSAANRAKFVTTGVKLVDLGANGETPTGASPIMFFKGASGSFNTNLGTGGNFSVTGALTDCADDPPSATGFIPYPNPRYALTGGMQPMQGGV